MKYVLLVSHGVFAKGLHSVLDMMAGKDRNDVLSTSLIDGMSVETFSEKVEEVVKDITDQDEIIILADLVGGSPLTTTLNVLDQKGLLKNVTAFGGANLSLALNAVLLKDTLSKDELKKAIIDEAKNSIEELELNKSNEEDDDI